MKDPPIQLSPRSSRNWPPLDVELRGSPRLAAAWALWCFALGAGLWWGCDLPWWCRLGLLCLVTLALRQGVRSFLAGGGKLRCEPDGQWRYEPPQAATSYVQIAAPRLLGPLLWLGWPVVDSSRVEPNAWRAIKARMRFPGPVGHK
jgi:hypothetical protein